MKLETDCRCSQKNMSSHTFTDGLLPVFEWFWFHSDAATPSSTLRASTECTNISLPSGTWCLYVLPAALYFRPVQESAGNSVLEACKLGQDIVATLFID